MGYLIAALLVLLVVGGFVTFLVLNATKRSNAGAVGEGAPPGIGGDETPLGDTREHAGEQTAGGATARDPEAGGEARDAPAGAHRARPATGPESGTDRPRRAPARRARASRSTATPTRTSRRRRRPSGSPTAGSEPIVQVRLR